MNWLIAFLLMLDVCLSDTEPPVNNACCYDEKLVKEKFLGDEAVYETYLAEVRWPKSIVYYDIDPHIDPVVIHYIAKAIDYFNANGDTCVKWEQRPPDGSEDAIRPHDHWVSFVTVRDDYRSKRYGDEAVLRANVGWKLGYQTNHRIIYMGRRYCKQVLAELIKTGKTTIPDPDHWRSLEMITVLLHEMMHVMGVQHEQERGDRDCWVYVSDKYNQKLGYNLNPSSWKAMFSPKFPYDFRSIMHYKTNWPDFYAHDGSEMGRSDGRLSPLDWDKLNWMYCRHKPAYCDATNKCKLDLEGYRINSKCFREGPKYHKLNYTCNPCYRPGPIKQ